METIYFSKIIKVGSSQGVAIPKNILQGMKWSRGDLVIYGFSGKDQLTIRRLTDKEIRQMKSDIKF